MVEPADRLTALFEADEAPAFDAAFTLAVIAEVERREAMRTLAWSAAYAGLGLILMVAGWPAILALSGGMTQVFGAASPILAAGAVGAAIFILTPRLKVAAPFG